MVCPSGSAARLRSPAILREHKRRERRKQEGSECKRGDTRRRVVKKKEEKKKEKRKRRPLSTVAIGRGRWRAERGRSMCCIYMLSTSHRRQEGSWMCCDPQCTFSGCYRFSRCLVYYLNVKMSVLVIAGFIKSEAALQPPTCREPRRADELLRRG